MQRSFALFLAVPLIVTPWVNDAFAQAPAAYGESYDDPDAPYDDYDAQQPYDEQYAESYDQPVDPAVGSIDTFHAALEPYGTWVRSPEFGLVWVPSRAVVGASFVPYSTGGSWQYTTSGWMFASDWRWGWAPFHYGRWYHDAGHGWCWVPGSVWAPSWVDWRFGSGVVGWAPLPPRHHRTVWMYANARDINRRHIDRYVYRNSLRYHLMTVPVRQRIRSGRSYWYAGPRRDQVEQAGRIRIRPMRLRPPEAGIVVKVRVDAGRVRQERAASPRDRTITRSRQALPSQHLRRPAMRAAPRATPRAAPATRAAPAPRAAPATRQPLPGKKLERDRSPRSRDRKPDRR